MNASFARPSRLIALLVGTAVSTLVLTACGSSTPEKTEPTPTPRATNGVYTMADVAKHSTLQDCWTVIAQKVYDLSGFSTAHPGGDRISVICGKDGSGSFFIQHAMSESARTVLGNMIIGTLAPETGEAAGGMTSGTSMPSGDPASSDMSDTLSDAVADSDTTEPAGE